MKKKISDSENGEDCTPSVRKSRKINRVTTLSQQSEVTPISEDDILSPISGAIEKIILKNIFCHEYLYFDGFTRVNLFQGPNGSGKSSIVAAIIAGLGGSSKATDRGSNIKSLIQHGKQWASIELHLGNKGLLPYKPGDFGEKVIVQRRITISGTTSYKILSANGKVVSTKKEDLTRILDYFGIQVDNPIIILSQERAKSFLTSTTPKDLFELYMSATQMKSFQEYLNDTQKNVNSLATMVKHKDKNLPMLAKEVKELGKRIEEINALEGKRKTLIHLQKAKAWAEVMEDEVELAKHETAYGKVAAIVTRLAEVSESTCSQVKKLDEEHKELDRALIKLSQTSRSCECTRAEKQESLTAARKRLREAQHARRTIEDDAFEKRAEQDALRKRVEQECGGATAEWERAMAELNGERNTLKEKMTELEQRQQTEETHGAHIEASLREAEHELSLHVTEENAIKSRLAKLEMEQRHVNTEMDDLTIFGAHMPRIVRQIEAANIRKAFRKMPVGPIGSFIKVKDSEWLHIVETVTRPLLLAFLVDNSHDFRQLSAIFKEIIPQGSRMPQIITSPFRGKLHDVRRFETGYGRLVSMWQLVESDNKDVLNTLLDQLRVESILLVPTAQQASDLLIEASKVPKNCESAMTLNGDTYYPDPDFRVYSGTGSRRVTFLQISVQDKIKDLESNIANTRAEVCSSFKEGQEKKRQRDELQREHDNSRRKLERIHQELRSVRLRLQELRNREVAPPIDAEQVKAELRDAEALLEQLQEKREATSSVVSSCSKEVQEAERHLEQASAQCTYVRQQLDEHETKTRSVQSQLDQEHRRKAAMVQKKDSLAKELVSQQTKVEEARARLQRRNERITNADPNRINPEKSAREYEREIEALRSAVASQEASFGDLSAASQQWHDKRSRYESLKKEISNHYSFITKMRKSLSDRQHLFQMSKKGMMFMVKSNFHSKIRHRQLEGDVELDYKAKTLDIWLAKKTLDKDSNESRRQSIAMLSGGERSFATVCLVLTLWEMIPSPFRVMDEFDIFMDVVTRSQCLDLLLNTVQKNVQYIMVSPLEYESAADRMHVFRLSAPKRKKQKTADDQNDDDES